MLKYLLIFSIILTGCNKKTQFGECVGINGEKDITLKYKYDEENIIVGVLFAEMIFPPLLVVLDRLECPIAKKEK